jgi:hypothetical protein
MRLNTDGTVTYWSVYAQTWIVGAHGVPDAELAAMPREESDAIQAHLAAAEDLRGGVE